MKRSPSYQLVLVTAPNLKVARVLAGQALQNRLAACANLVPKIESHYWWQGKLERSNEILLLFKTTQAKLRLLEQCILEHHPYDTPEFIALPLSHGNTRYLDWITASLK